MNDYDNIQVSTLDRVGLIELNRPDALNAINISMLKEIMHALQAFDKDESVGAVVIGGTRRVFSVGADISEMIDASSVELLTSDAVAGFEEIRSIRKPIIAAVSGYCLGGGCELAMSCDLIVASRTARFGQPEINLGVIPGAGGTQRLPRAVGKVLAMEMILNNRHLRAQEAQQYGLINKVVEPEEFMDTAIKLAAEIASKAPLAVQMAKEMINQAYELPLKEGLASERRSFYMLFSSQDQKEGMQAFNEKRPPEWKGK